MLFAEYTRIKVKQFRETLLLHMGNVKKFVAERTRHKRQYDRRMNERQMQSRESKVVSSKALDASLVVTECVNDQEPSTEVHLTAQHNVLANEQHHTNQSEPSYDTYLLEKVDSNITLESTNMFHRGGEIDQDAEQDQVKSSLLKAEFLKTNDMVEKEVYNELLNRFLQLEKHCISLEISIQQKEESFQSNKPYILQNTTDGRKPKPRSNNQTSRSLPVPKSSHGMLNGVALVDHSRNSSSFSDSKHFVCSTCQKCVFNANLDDCITKFLKEVNCRTKDQSPKSRNNIKPAKRIPNVNKSERWISKGYRFSLNKSSTVHEKPNTPRYCLRWKPTGRIFKTVGLRWIPTVKMFVDCITKVDSEPLNGSNNDITNLYECDQTLNVSAYTLNLSAVPEVPTPVPAALTSSPSSTTVDQDAPSTSTSQTTSKQQFLVIPQEPSSEEKTLEGVIPSSFDHLNQSFDTLTKLTKKHPLENVIGDPS
uniref:Integrase, catalytic region, zinc finger, CCHC-type, peptidase aspartic, catalytic n=1 Tax=Tanacetum cinerariifolium TaxID=118510 RepID=A0A6L2NXD8_TANCI|nr:hypothetical protein [Tanacetum cinerariifolium]